MIFGIILGGIGLIGLLLYGPLSGDGLGIGMLGRCGAGRTDGDGLPGRGTCLFGAAGDCICGEGKLGETFGEGRLGEILGDGLEGEGIGMLDEGGFGISFGRLCIGIWEGGTLRRFSKESCTSFRMKSHSTWYDVYPAQETTLAHFPVNN
jgi:hypothetical protein